MTIPPTSGQPFPAAPPPSGGELRRPERPKSVETASLFWLVAIGASIVSNVIGVFIADQVAQKTLDMLAQKGVNVDTMNSGPNYGASIFGFVLLVAFTALVFTMRRGANWARIVLTVLAALQILGIVFSVLLGAGLLVSVGLGGVLQLVLSVVALVAVVGALIFMFKSESSRYFKAS